MSLNRKVYSFSKVHKAPRRTHAFTFSMTLCSGKHLYCTMILMKRGVIPGTVEASQKKSHALNKKYAINIPVLSLLRRDTRRVCAKQYEPPKTPNSPKIHLGTRLDTSRGGDARRPLDGTPFGDHTIDTTPEDRKYTLVGIESW